MDIMEMIVKIIGISIAIGAFAILIDTPMKYMWYTAVVGCVGGGAFLLGTAWEVDQTVLYFVSALLITVVSNVIAKLCKAPVTVFLIAGILPSVPGAGIYRVAYNMMIGEIDLSLFHFVETLKFAGAISLAIVVGEVVFRTFVGEYMQKYR